MFGLLKSCLGSLCHLSTLNGETIASPNVMKNLTVGGWSGGFRAAARQARPEIKTARTTLPGGFVALQSSGYSSIFAPSNFMNCDSQAGCAGQAGAETRLPWVTAWLAGMEAYSPPALVTSGPTAG